MIVTISRVYGAAAIDVAHEVGVILGYQVAGENFSKIVGARLGTPKEDVEAVEARAPSLAEWILDNLGSGSPEMQDSIAPQKFEEDVRREIETTVLEAAAEGNVVIIGGFANMVLRDRKDKLSTFLHASLSYRVGRIQASLGISAEEARKEIQRIDSARRRSAKIHYKIEWGAAWYYDLAIDVSRLGIAGTARQIASAVRELEGAPPPEVRGA